METRLKNIDIAEEWFNDVVANLRKDELLYKTGKLPDERKDVYNAFINKEYDKIMHNMSEAAIKHFTIQILTAYDSYIKTLDINPIFIGVCYGDREVLVWSEINDDDDKTETELFKAEAVINASFINTGICISSTIVEKSDKIKMPGQYKILYPNA